MPKLDRRLTDSLAQSLRIPAVGYEIHWCPQTPGFGIRITAAGARAWIVERRVDGKTVRRTVGAASGRNAISAQAARANQVDVSSELSRGIDRSADRREQAKRERTESVTFGDVLRDYVEKKRRGKDGLPLASRTKADYLAMLTSGRERADGSATLAGELHSLADKAIGRITAADIRKLHSDLKGRGERRQSYAMQVLRAALAWHGTKIDGNPLSKETAGKDQIKIAPPRARGKPIPAERIGAWWQAACATTGRAATSADVLRFALLTGARGGEVAQIAIGDVDLDAGRVTLRDTKARNDHTVYLSRQATEIAKRYTTGKTKNSDLLFGIADTGRTLATINSTVGVADVTPHGMRKTFATIASELLPGATVKRLVNHVDANDVTENHYVRRSEATLRAAWQTVADWIEAQSANASQAIEE